jgi:hypothetical protein
MKPLDMRTMKVSRPVLALLVVTLGLIVYAYFHGAANDTAGDRAAPVAAVSKKPAAAMAASAASAASAALGASAVEMADAQRPAPVDIFPNQNWQPPPPPPPPPSLTPLKPAKPPPPPEPPPLPFAVRSLWLDQRGEFYVLLSGTGREFTLCATCSRKGFLKKGDVILNAYRIEDINRKEVRFVYLPLKRRQTLALGELK